MKLMPFKNRWHLAALFYARDLVNGRRTDSGPSLFIDWSSDWTFNQLVVSGSSGTETVIGSVNPEIVGENLEVSLQVTHDGCCLKETHICNLPTVIDFNVDCPKEHKFSVYVEEIYSFVCVADEDNFLVSGHASVSCDAGLDGMPDDTTEGMEEHHYAAMYEVKLTCCECIPPDPGQCCTEGVVPETGPSEVCAGCVLPDDSLLEGVGSTTRNLQTSEIFTQSHQYRFLKKDLTRVQEPLKNGTRVLRGTTFLARWLWWYEENAGIYCLGDVCFFYWAFISCPITDVAVTRIENTCKTKATLEKKLECLVDEVKKEVDRIDATENPGTKDYWCRHYAVCVEKIADLLDLPHDFETGPDHAYNSFDTDAPIAGTYYMDAQAGVLIFVPE